VSSGEYIPISIRDLKQRGKVSFGWKTFGQEEFEGSFPPKRFDPVISRPDISFVVFLLHIRGSSDHPYV